MKTLFIAIISFSTFPVFSQIMFEKNYGGMD
jgi:hypothetical protein